MNIRPLNDMLIVKRLQPSEYKSASGIILPPVEESSDTPYQGTVLAAGPGKPCKLQPASQDMVDAMLELIQACASLSESGHGINHGIARNRIERASEALQRHNNTVMRIPMQVRVGDTVVFSKNLFQEFKLDGELVIAFGQDSVLGVIPQD